MIVPSSSRSPSQQAFVRAINRQAEYYQHQKAYAWQHQKSQPLLNSRQCHQPQPFSGSDPHIGDRVVDSRGKKGIRVHPSQYQTWLRPTQTQLKSALVLFDGSQYPVWIPVALLKPLAMRRSTC